MENPYQPPVTLDEPLVSSSDAKFIRIKHIGRESIIRALANLCIATSCLLFLATAIGDFRDELRIPANLPAALITFGIGLFALILGVGLRGLRRWAQVGAAIPACISMAAFPFGTIPGIFILTVLLNRKGTKVFSSGYQEVIAETSGMKLRPSSALAVLLLIALLAIIASMLWRSFGPFAQGE